MKKLLLLFGLVLGMAFATSCNNDDDSDSQGVNIIALTLTPDSNTVFEGQPVTFTVQASLSDTTSVDVTADSKFTANGEEITNPFTPSEAGTYNIMAKHGSFSADYTLEVQVGEMENNIIYEGQGHPVMNAAWYYWGTEEGYSYYSIICSDAVSEEEFIGQVDGVVDKNNYLDIELIRFD